MRGLRILRIDPSASSTKYGPNVCKSTSVNGSRNVARQKLPLHRVQTLLLRIGLSCERALVRGSIVSVFWKRRPSAGWARTMQVDLFFDRMCFPPWATEARARRRKHRRLSLCASLYTLLRHTHCVTRTSTKFVEQTKAQHKGQKNQKRKNRKEVGQHDTWRPRTSALSTACPQGPLPRRTLASHVREQEEKKEERRRRTKVFLRKK